MQRAMPPLFISSAIRMKSGIDASVLSATDRYPATLPRMFCAMAKIAPSSLAVAEKKKKRIKTPSLPKTMLKWKLLNSV